MSDPSKPRDLDVLPISPSRVVTPGGFAIEESPTVVTDSSKPSESFADEATRSIDLAALEAQAPQAYASGALYGPPLPPDAPDWMRFARLVSATIERAIADGRSSLTLRASIGRAWAAWQLGGYPPTQIAQVARRVERAHAALRATGPDDRAAVADDCVTLLMGELPEEIRRWMRREAVAEVVAQLAREPDAVAARTLGTARLLGWTAAAGAWAAEAIAIALGEQA